MKLWKVEKFSAKKCQKHFYSSLSDARVKTISLSSIFAWIQRQFSNSEQKMKLLLFLIEILCNGNRHNTNNLNDSFKDSFQMKGFHSPLPLPHLSLSLSFFLLGATNAHFIWLAIYFYQYFTFLICRIMKRNFDYEVEVEYRLSHKNVIFWFLLLFKLSFNKLWIKIFF